MGKFITGLLTVAVLASVSAPTVGAAGSSSLNFSAKSGSYKTGSSFTLSVIENSGSEGINVVEANFLFDESKLQLVSKSCNNAVFGVTAPGQGNGMTCGSYSPVTGVQVVASVTFKALADGVVSLGFADTSRIYEAVNGTDVWSHDASYSNFTLTAPVAQPAVKKTATATPVATAPVVAEAPKEEVKAEETTKAEEQSAPVVMPAAVEEDKVSVWAYLGVFLLATAVAAGVVYRDNLKKLAQKVQGNFNAKTVAPAAAVAGASVAKTKSTAARKKAPAKKPAKKTTAKKR